MKAQRIAMSQIFAKSILYLFLLLLLIIFVRKITSRSFVVPHQEDVSSELSIELSHHEEQLLSLSFQEDEETDEEDEELPSFLMAKSEKR